MQKDHPKAVSVIQDCALFRFISKITIFKSIIKSQFSYCPLVWMFRPRTCNNAINKINHRAQRITLDKNIDSLVELQAILQGMTKQHRNIHILMVKVVNNFREFRTK